MKTTKDDLYRQVQRFWDTLWRAFSGAALTPAGRTRGGDLSLSIASGYSVTSAVIVAPGDERGRGPVMRSEAQDDHRAVFAVHAAAFPTPAEAHLVAAIRSGGRASVSLVAELDGQVVGHILFSPVSVEQGDAGDGVGLAPVAVLPNYQGQGIGSRLIRAGLAAATAAGMTFCVVLGAPAYYQRFGFRRASEFGLGNDYGADEEFMVVELRPGELTGRVGLVRYCSEFAALGV